MTISDLVCFILGGLSLTGVFLWILTLFIDGARHKLWPRGLRWLPGRWLRTSEGLYRLTLRVFWPEKAAAFKGRDLLELESWDAQWRTWRGVSEGGIPQWDLPAYGGRGHWSPRAVLRDPCPCGYLDECTVHCGSGHADGRCPTHDVTLTDPALED